MSVGDRRCYKYVSSLLLCLCLPLLLASTGCGGAASGSMSSTRTLLAIATSPGTANISIGADEQFTATGSYSDGSTADVTASASWTDANAAVATISPSGMAKAVAVGSTTITAALDGVSGSATLTVPAATKTLTAIATSPATADISIGTTEQFTATGSYSDGSTADVTASASWTDANAAVATISASGMAKAVAAGSTTITATLNGLSGSATLTVPAATKTVTSIAVSPATATVAAGATQQFAATATYSDGSTANVTATVSWTSSNPAIATITSAGLATGRASGSVTVTATLNGVSKSATVTVLVPAATLTSIAVSPATASIAAKTTQQFTAMGKFSDGLTADLTGKVSWASSNTSVATLNASGLASAVAAGATTVTASLSGVSGTAALTVTPTLSTISIMPNPANIQAGATQQFTAKATYSDNSMKDVTSTATWTTANTAVATVNPATGLARGVGVGSTAVTATLNGISGSATLNVTGVTISIAPDPATFAMGATQQFTATAKNPDGATTDVTATAIWTAANTAVATVNANGLATGVAAGSTFIKASLNGASGSAPITVTIAAGAGVNIPTWHVDNNRSGLNANETSLTPANVAGPTFGKLFSYLVDGYAYAEPLLMSNVTIKGAAHNVLYVATENDSVYAFDADNYGTGVNAGKPLWQVSLLQSGETPLTGASVLPVQGITSTPVIDPLSNTIYVVSAQKSSANGASYRLSALDITTGAQKHSPVTITASVPGTNSTTDNNGMVSLPAGCVQRAALLLTKYGPNKALYIGVGSCHSGWLLSYDPNTLAQTGVFNASPNIDGEGTYGGAGGIWMGSGGPVEDSAGNVYISTGNGPWDPSQGSYGDSILKFNPTPVKKMLQVADYFTPEEYGYMNCQDSDLAAGGLLMIPGSRQIVGGGKMGKIYLIKTAQMGHEQALDAGALQTLFVEQGVAGSQPYPSSCTDKDALGNTLPNGKTYNVGGPNDSNGDTNDGINSYEIFGTSAYFNNSVYLGVTPTSGSAPGVVRRFSYASGVLTSEEFTSLSVTQQQPQNTRGTTPFISANGTSDGILWTIDQGQPIQSASPTNATLYAYDATNLSNELYGSDVSSADQPGYGIKFTSPIVANGKVYISTGKDLPTVAHPQGEIDVYGLK